jgi:hypothetical protein
MAIENATVIHLTLDEAECALLQQILQQALIDTHAERRRTEAPEFHAQVARQEQLVRTLLGKVRSVNR